MIPLKSIMLSFVLIFAICRCLAQSENGVDNSDEGKIMKNIKPFNFIYEEVKTIKIPKRKYDSPFFCDEFIDYRNGIFVNSIASDRSGGRINFTTNFFYYNIADKSITKIKILDADTIEAISNLKDILYYSVIKNGKRNIGYVDGGQYKSILETAAPDIRKQLDTASWVKLGVADGNLFLLSPDNLFEYSNNKWTHLTHYSIYDLNPQKKENRRGSLILPTKNIVVRNNKVYFIQEIVQQRSCRLLILNIANGAIEDYFTSLDYTDNYSKVINDFTILNDNSLLVSASRLMETQMLINTMDRKVEVWVFNNSLTTATGTKVGLPVTTVFNMGDSLLLASKMGLFLKYSGNIKPLVYFENYHQEIKDKEGVIDFTFDPRSVKRVGENMFIIGGLWGGLYQVDLFNKKITCLDDINYDKIKDVELSKF